MTDSILSTKRQVLIDHIVMRYEVHVSRIKRIVNKMAKKHSCFVNKAMKESPMLASDYEAKAS